MANDKSISIRFDEDDMEELREFMRWRMNKNFVSIDSNFDLREAAGLIKQAQLEKQQILRRIEAQRGAEKELNQQRENISLLPDRETERIEAEWREQATAQARSYSEARNRNSQPRSTIGTDASITEGVLSWIKRSKLRGWRKKDAE